MHVTVWQEQGETIKTYDNLFPCLPNCFPWWPQVSPLPSSQPPGNGYCYPCKESTWIRVRKSDCNWNFWQTQKIQSTFSLSAWIYICSMKLLQVSLFVYNVSSHDFITDAFLIKYWSVFHTLYCGLSINQKLQII